MDEHQTRRDGLAIGRLGAALCALALLVGTVAVNAMPASAAKPPGHDTTTTTTTVAPGEDEGSFNQWEDASDLSDYNPMLYEGSLYRVVQRVGASYAWTQGLTGQGIDIALIDSGVAPVDGLTYPGKVINGPDLSFESQADNLRHLDTNGHGTHLAGIIAGRGDAVTEVALAHADHEVIGVAPDARIVSLKVADSQGAVDVTQVIAAIDWVVQHRNDNGMNIRVLNLAYGTDGLQDYQIDPLAYAVEQAWEAGIVVVVAAGNDGLGSALRNPATDPFVITVGASHGQNMKSQNPIAEFSSCGTEDRHVDVLAPGRSIVSLRTPGSAADTHHPEAVVAGQLFLGSGTSQASAVTSGAVALLLQQRPDLTPDQVKALLMTTAETNRKLDPICAGAGEVDLFSALWETTPNVVQSFASSTGTGSLEAARGTHHVYDEGVELSGEQDIFGNSFDTTDWAAAAEIGQSWSGGTWSGASWSGASWSGASWSGASWSGASWSGASWSGASWSSKSWSGASWSGASWSGASWSGASWSGASWSGNNWLGFSWQ
jgi:serine protease AprX